MEPAAYPHAKYLPMSYNPTMKVKVENMPFLLYHYHYLTYEDAQNLS
jgi:hypothetical protein